MNSTGPYNYFCYSSDIINYINVEICVVTLSFKTTQVLNHFFKFAIALNVITKFDCTLTVQSLTFLLGIISVTIPYENV